MPEPFQLNRFVVAQAPLIDSVRAELAAGRKRSHWMWFIFPQIAGLGHSDMARRYALAGRDEARAYLAHPVLGPRLLECSALVVNVTGRDIDAIFGAPDNLKFHSSMTLFARAAPHEVIFQDCLRQYFHGQADAATLQLLGVS